MNALPVAEGADGGVYGQLERALVVREENVELTSLVGAIGLVLLLAAAGISTARGGRLP